MRILLVSHGFPPDECAGTELYASGVATSLSALGHQVSVFTANPSSGSHSRRVDCDGGVQVERWFHRVAHDEAHIGPARPEAEAAFREALARTRPDVVHILHLLYLSPTLVAEARRDGRAVVLGLNDFWFLCPLVHLSPDRTHPLRGRLWGAACFWHTDATSVRQVLSLARRGRLPSRAREQFARAGRMRDALRQAHRLVAPSAFVRDRFVEFGVAPGSIEVIPYGLEGDTPADHGWPRPGGPRFGYLGILHQSKGADLLVDAFRGVDAPDARLTVRGAELKPAYLQLVRDLAAGDPRIEIGSRVPDDELPSFFAALDVLVVPTRVHETFSRVAHEAIRARVPVVASRLGALPEIIVPGQNGLLFEPGDRDDLAATIELLARDGDSLRRLQQFGHVKTMDEHAGELLDLYGRALAEG